MHRLVQRRAVVSAVAQLAWSVALLVGLPVGLAVGFGWPLPTEVPDWDQVTSTPLRFVDPVVIVNGFVCLAWVCWILVTAYTIGGIIDMIRGAARRHHRIGPLATLAGKTVTSVMLLTSLARPVTVAALPQPNAAAMVDIGDDLPGTPLQPGDPTSPADASDALSAEAAASSTTLVRDPVYVVQRGDTLWDIAETHLGDAFRWTEIRDLNPQLLANPSLIRSGWQLTLPADADLPSAAAGAAPDPEPDPALDLAIPAPTPAPALELDATTDTTDTTLSQPENDQLGDESDDTVTAPLATVVAGLTGATVLAAGLSIALRRRRRRWRAGPLPFTQLTDLEQALVAAADVPLVRWVGQELAGLGSLLENARHQGVPVAVEFSEATGIEILWDHANPNPPAHWTAEPGDWSWRLPYDPSAPVPEADLPSVLPGLVTIGHREGRQLMVNLETLGAVAIVGDPEPATDLLRSMLAELALNDEISDAHVAVAEPDPGFGLPGEFGIVSMSVDDALERLHAAVSEAEDLVGRVGCSTSFGYRTFSEPVLPLEVAVVAGHADIEALVSTAQRLPCHRAAAVLVLGECDGIENRIVVTSDGTGRLEPLGIDFTAAALPAGTGADLDTLLATGSPLEDDMPPTSGVAPPVGDGAELKLWWIDPEPVVTIDGLDTATNDAHLAAPVSETGGDGAVCLPRVPEPRMLVKVLGSPRLVDGPQLGRRELVVVALVACSGRRVTHEQVQDAIWGSSPVTTKTVFNLIGSARAALGTWDGQPVLSAATRPDNVIELHPDVATDLHVLRALVPRARQAPSAEAMRLLIDALELVEGPPFDAPGYDWAVTSQLVSEAEHLIEQAAIMAAELALECGDLNRARWAAVQGLRAVPGDEALYRLRMRIEDAAGNPSGVRRAFDELVSHLDEFGLGPSPETTALLAGLTTAPHRQPPPHGSPTFSDSVQ